jgi:hypothetical protein
MVGRRSPARDPCAIALRRARGFWSERVPPEVAEVIRRRGFFGYKRPAPAAVEGAT